MGSGAELVCYRVRMRVGERRFDPIISAFDPGEARDRAAAIAANLADPELPWTSKWVNHRSSLRWDQSEIRLIRVEPIHPDNHSGERTRRAKGAH